MKIEIKAKSNKISLIAAIIFLIIGVLMLANPNQVIAIISYICGIIAIIYGIYACIKNYYNTKANSNNPSTELVIGIVSIIIGILFLLLANVIAVAIQYVFGAWILFSGINRLINGLQIDKSDNNFIVQIVISSLLILAGLYTILKSNLALQFIGIIMIIYAVLEIVAYVSNKKDDPADAVVTITPNDNEAKTEDIKEAKVIEDTKANKKNKKSTKK